MHDALAMTEIQCFQQFMNVEADIIINESRIERPEVGVVYILENKTRSLALTIAHNIQVRKQIRTPDKFCKILISRFIFFFLTGFNTLMTHF